MGRAASHGQTYTPTWNIWWSMIQRDRVAEGRYKNISVCERWQNYLNFLADMGEKPGEEYSIDRVDNNKGYSPDNCRWATVTQQARNRSSNTFFTYRGETLCIAEWAEKYNMPQSTLKNRIYRWQDIERALTTPRRKRRSNQSGKE